MFFKEYKDYIRPIHLEETSDYLIFRPLAFVVLKLTSKLPLTPNIISYFALISALVSGYFLSTGMWENFVYAGIGIFSFCVLDCCDGMLARKLAKTKGYSNPMGEIVDMFVDLLASISYFVGLSIGMSKIAEWEALTFLPYVSGAIIFIHATLFHFYKKQFGYHSEGNKQNLGEHLQKFRELKEQKTTNAYDRFLISMFLAFSKLEYKKSCKASDYQSAEYIRENKKILPFWALIAGSNHLFFLSLSLIAGKLEIFFFYSIIFSNIWMAFTYGIQVFVNKRCLAGVLK